MAQIKDMLRELLAGNARIEGKIDELRREIEKKKEEVVAVKVEEIIKADEPEQQKEEEPKQQTVIKTKSKKKKLTDEERAEKKRIFLERMKAGREQAKKKAESNVVLIGEPIKL